MIYYHPASRKQEQTGPRRSTCACVRPRPVRVTQARGSRRPTRPVSILDGCFKKFHGVGYRAQVIHHISQDSRQGARCRICCAQGRSGCKPAFPSPRSPDWDDSLPASAIIRRDPIRTKHSLGLPTATPPSATATADGVGAPRMARVSAGPWASPLFS